MGLALLVCGDQVQLKVHTDQAKPISPDLFGLFFEEISHAGAGGLYAEMVGDRSFFSSGGRSELGFWSVVPSPGDEPGDEPPSVLSLLDHNVVVGNLTASLRLPLDQRIVAVRNR